MAEIRLTAKQIQNLGLWGKVCQYKGWSLRESVRINEDELITFDDCFNKKRNENLETIVTVTGKLYEFEEADPQDGYTRPFGDFYIEEEDNPKRFTDLLLERSGRTVRVTVEVID